VGAGGHGAVVADIVMRMAEAGEDIAIVAFVDDQPAAAAREMCGVPIVAGGLAALSTIAHDAVVVAIGNNAVRRRMSDEIRRTGTALAIARHPSSVVAPDARIGAGTVVCAGAVVNPGARVGYSAILNTHSSIDHHDVIGDCAHIGPGVHLGGHVTVGDETLIGIGSTVMPQIQIGGRVVVGAGSVVIRNLPDGAVAYGVPARTRTAAVAPRRAAVGRAPGIVRHRATAHD
jgi:sugar O-acyltransferase (sialic acid O-acetyltransferase NeuD family)